MDRILVTGGAGYIGSHICVALLEKGYDLIIIDSYINSSPISVKRVYEICTNSQKYSINNNIKFFKGDLRNEIFLKNIFRNSEIESKPIKGVIHLAGLKSVKDSCNQPLDYWDSNVASTITLLKVMKLFNCKTLVFSSSATVYGVNFELPIPETSKVNPTNPYGKTKLAIEEILKSLQHSDPNHWKIAILRYFNPIGAHHSGLIGESPIGTPNNIFPIITKVAIRKIKELNIYGNDWETKDGTGIRDYIHVMDIADGHLMSLENLFRESPKIVTLNLGTGLGTSVLELVNTFQIVNNVEIPYKIVKRREGDIASLIADNNLAVSTLNWRPRNNIEHMCRDGWKWQKLNPNGFQE